MVSIQAKVSNTTTGQSSSSSSSRNRNNNEKSETNNNDYVLIKVVSRLVLDVITRCWALSGISVLAIFLIYWLNGGLFTFLLLCFAATGVLYQASDWMLYHPEQPSHSRFYVASPTLLGLTFDNIFLKTKDGVRLNAFFIKQPDTFSKAPSILFLHGNAGNIGHRLFNAKGLCQLSGCNVFMLEYRGYGHSDGSPSEKGLYLDVQAGLEHLWSRTDIDKSKIVVFGRSLGGAVAIDIASRSQHAGRIMALIVENSFTSIPDIARVLFNTKFIHWLPTWCYRNQFLSKSKIARIKSPTLFISGLSDWLIPPWMMQELYEASVSSMKRIAKFESGTHNETWQCDGYYRVLSLFLDDVMFSLADRITESQDYTKCEASVVHIPLDIV